MKEHSPNPCPCPCVIKGYHDSTFTLILREKKYKVKQKFASPASSGWVYHDDCHRINKPFPYDQNLHTAQY